MVVDILKVEFFCSDWDADERGGLSMLQVWILHQVRSGHPEGSVKSPEGSVKSPDGPIKSSLHSFNVWSAHQHGVLNLVLIPHLISEGSIKSAQYYLLENGHHQTQFYGHSEYQTTPGMT